MHHRSQSIMKRDDDRGPVQERRFRAQYDNIRVKYAGAMGADGSALIQRLGLSLGDYAHAAMGVRTNIQLHTS
jgi:hypothetical protein